MSVIKYLSPELIIVPAGANVALSKSFSSAEFEDITCSFVIINMQLIQRLQLLRDHLMTPIKITSGFRSATKQAQLKAQGYETAEGPSTHEYGCAADLNAYGRFSGRELETAARAVGFKAVGVAKTWIHVDLRADKDRRWEYL